MRSFRILVILGIMLLNLSSCSKPNKPIENSKSTKEQVVQSKATQQPAPILAPPKPQPAPYVPPQAPYVPPQAPPTPPPAPQPKPQYRAPCDLLGWNFYSGKYGMGHVIGFIGNNSQSTISYAQISFNLYDRNGFQVGTAFDNISNLGPGSIWKFDALVMNEDAITAKIAEFTIF